MRIIIAGSRYWNTIGPIYRVLRNLPPGAVIVEGGAKGADSVARMLADDLGLTVETYQADWEQYGKAAGGIRNQQMVDAGADLVYLFPLPGSRGTWDLARRAKAAGIEVRNQGTL